MHMLKIILFQTFRRDTIVTRGDAQTKVTVHKQTLTKGSFQRQMSELKKKIKTTIQVTIEKSVHAKHTWPCMSPSKCPLVDLAR